MGLFDKIKSKVNDPELRKDLKNLTNRVGRVIEDTMDQIEDKVVETAKSYQKSPQTQSRRQTNNAEEQSVYDVPNPRSDAELFSDFKRLINENFSDYEVRYDVAVSELKPGAHPKCIPFRFLFYKDGEPVLAILFVNKNNYGGRNVKGTFEACSAIGLKFVRFFVNYANSDEYVVQRIKDNL